VRVVYSASKARRAGKDVRRESRSPLECVMMATRASADVDKGDSVRLASSEEQSLKRSERPFDWYRLLESNTSGINAG
jgi:hypothetical protein